MIDDSCFEIERGSIMRGSRRVFVKVLVIQLDGRGHSKDDATPSFCPDSKNSMVGLPNEVSFVSKISWKSC